MWRRDGPRSRGLKNTKSKLKLFRHSRESGNPYGRQSIALRRNFFTWSKAAGADTLSSGSHEAALRLHLASKPHGTLYVGVTSDLGRRVFEHKTGALGGFTSRYSVYRLVYAESHASMDDAIAREKQIKKWRRAWKIEMIERGNPSSRDLYNPQSL